MTSSQLACSVNWLERITGIAEVRVRIPASLIFSFRNCISCVNNCEDLLYIYLTTVCSVLYIAKQGWRVRNEETFQRSSTKALKILPPPQNPNQYTPACIMFLKFSLRSQKFTISGQKSRRFRHKSGLCLSSYPLADRCRHGYTPS